MISHTQSPADDVTTLLSHVADHLFSAATHFQSCRRLDEATYVSRIAIEVAVRVEHLKATGKITSPSSPKKLLSVLRCINVVNKQVYRVLVRMWEGTGQQLTTKEMRLLCNQFRTAQHVDAPSQPRDKSEAQYLYSGCSTGRRSLVRPTSRTRPEVEPAPDSLADAFDACDGDLELAEPAESFDQSSAGKETGAFNQHV